MEPAIDPREEEQRSMVDNSRRQRPSRTELWLRRIVSSLLLLVVLALLAWGIVAAVRYISNLFDQQGAAQSSVDAAQSFSIPTCTVDDLEFSLQAASATASAGGKMDFTLTVENQTGTACRWETSRMRVEVTTGDLVVWQGTECDNSWQKTLLLSNGQPWSAELTWNGLFYRECTVLTETVDGKETERWTTAGTYVAHLLVDEQEISSGASIVVE